MRDHFNAFTLARQAQIKGATMNQWPTVRAVSRTVNSRITDTPLRRPRLSLQVAHTKPSARMIGMTKITTVTSSPAPVIKATNDVNVPIPNTSHAVLRDSETDCRRSNGSEESECCPPSVVTGCSFVYLSDWIRLLCYNFLRVRTIFILSCLTFLHHKQ